MPGLLAALLSLLIGLTSGLVANAITAAWIGRTKQQRIDSLVSPASSTSKAVTRHGANRRASVASGWIDLVSSDAARAFLRKVAREDFEALTDDQRTALLSAALGDGARELAASGDLFNVIVALRAADVFAPDDAATADLDEEAPRIRDLAVKLTALVAGVASAVTLFVSLRSRFPIPNALVGVVAATLGATILGHATHSHLLYRRGLRFGLTGWGNKGEAKAVPHSRRGVGRKGRAMGP